MGHPYFKVQEHRFKDFSEVKMHPFLKSVQRVYSSTAVLQYYDSTFCQS